MDAIITMTIQLRPYQQNLVNDIYNQWQHVQSVCGVMPTGAGKAYTLSYIVREFMNRGQKCVVQVHRRELVGQLSCSLATLGVVHYIIGSKATKEFVKKLHLEQFGRIFLDDMARVCLASVQTLVGKKGVENWAGSVGLKVTDECHHVLASNTWGRCWELFPQAYGLGVTATPRRTDGYGLGSHTDGVFDRMVLGPTMRELIDMGNLCPIKAFIPPSDFKPEALKRGSNGEYTAASIADALEGSHVVGDAVKHYLRFMPNQQGIVFASSLDESDKIADAFNASGVPAASVSSKDDDEYRAKTVSDFKKGKLRVLSNYSLFDEGFDLPGLGGVIDCSPTTSTIKFHQRVGRCLRPAAGKSHGIYIDMVSNIKTETRGTHLLPDAPHSWTLDRTKNRSSEEDLNVPKLSSCLACFEPFDAFLPVCPHCGQPKQAGVARNVSAPVHLDDELVELTPERRALLIGEIEETRMDSTQWMYDKFGPAAAGIIPMKQRKNHKERKAALDTLDGAMVQWANGLRDLGIDDDTIREQFRRTFGIDIVQARVLKRAEAEKLFDRISNVL